MKFREYAEGRDARTGLINAIVDRWPNFLPLFIHADELEEEGYAHANAIRVLQCFIEGQPCDTQSWKVVDIHDAFLGLLKQHPNVQMARLGRVSAEGGVSRGKLNISVYLTLVDTQSMSVDPYNPHLGEQPHQYTVRVSYHGERQIGQFDIRVNGADRSAATLRRHNFPATPGGEPAPTYDADIPEAVKGVAIGAFCFCAANAILLDCQTQQKAGGRDPHYFDTLHALGSDGQTWTKGDINTLFQNPRILFAHEFRPQADMRLYPSNTYVRIPPPEMLQRLPARLRNMVSAHARDYMSLRWHNQNARDLAARILRLYGVNHVPAEPPGGWVRSLFS